MSIAPVLKKVSTNGQISLPKIYRDTYVQYREENNKIILEPMFWEQDLEAWLTKEEFLDLSGDNLWSAKKDNDNQGILLNDLPKNG